MENNLCNPGNRIDEQLQRIANVLLLNASFIDNLGLLNGKLGIAIFFYNYGRYSIHSIYTNFAGELIDEIYEEIDIKTPVDFANGLAGIGWGIEYLVRNGFLAADTDETLAEIDKTLYQSFSGKHFLTENESHVFDYGLYIGTRIHSSGKNNDRLNNPIIKDQIIPLIDKCERLFVHKEYPELMMQQMSVSTLNSYLWFFLEMDRLEISTRKIRKILNYLPDFILNENHVHNSYANWKLLQNLSEKATRQLPDTVDKEKYRSLFKRTEVELIRINGDDKHLLDDMQAMQLHKLIYGPYYNGIEIDPDSFAKVFSLITNEDNWDVRLKSINKNNLGLSGLAGTGLLLMEAAKNIFVET